MNRVVKLEYHFKYEFYNLPIFLYDEECESKAELICFLFV